MMHGWGEGRTYVDGADEVLGSRHDVCQEHGEQNSHDPSTNETLDCLLGGELDELRASKCHSADVREDVVGDDQRCGKEEPDHALKDVVHDEVCLNDDEVQSHVCPCEVGELESVVTSLKRCDEEDEAYFWSETAIREGSCVQVQDLPNT